MVMETEKEEVENNSMELTNVCQKLDQLTLDVFDLLDQIATSRLKLGDLLGTGHLQMSRARYNMGIKAIGAHKLPEENMEASVNIFVDPESETFAICKESDSAKITDDDSANKDSNLRKRNKQEKKSENEKSSKDSITELATEFAKTEIDDKREGRKFVDPLKWFGVLVPQSLRQSQKCFQESVQVVCELASLQHQLDLRRVEFGDLMKKKQLIVSDN